jgi:uncharacterized delta-60 repeat protein
VLAALAVPVGAGAAPGDRDPTFSADGLVTYPGTFRDLAVAADGSALVALNSANQGGVTRYAPNGRLDPEFGAAGGFAQVFCCNGAVTSLALRPGGRIVAGGKPANPNPGDFGLTELEPSGASACEAGGLCAITDFAGGADVLTDVFAEPSGRTLAAGIVANGPLDQLGVARYLSSGGLDNSFSGDGKLILDSNGVSTFAEKAVVAGLPDGSVLLAGAGPGPDGSGRGDLLLAKLEADGDLDPGFGGGDGWITVDIAVRDDADSIALGPDGAIFVGIRPCAFGLHTECGAAVAKFTPQGELDASFGAGGLIRDAAGSSVAATGAGSAFAAGTTALRPYFLGDFALAHYTASGALDPGFGRDGVASADFALTQDFGAGAAVTTTGSVVVGGTTGAELGLARFSVAAGPPDADADGKPDDADRCPERFARNKIGCPRIQRELELQTAGPRLRARIESEIDLCVARQRLKVIELRKGPDRVVARPRTGAGGGWRSDRLDPGLYRVQANHKVAGRIGRCNSLRPRAVRVG